MISPWKRKGLCCLTVLSLVGCQPPARNAQNAPDPHQRSDLLTDKVWMQTDTTGLPGPIRIFFSDGTLLIDSCWETYRLAGWRRESDSLLVLVEGNDEIPARIITLGARELRLRMQLVDGTEDHTYQRRTTPYLCPDMPR